MGGYRSGRYGGRPTAEACASYVLTADAMAGGNMRDGMAGEGTMTWSDGFAVKVAVDTRNPACRFLELEHERHTDAGGTVRYRVPLLVGRPPFGGVRWWFQCPRTGARACKLYLPRGGHQFWCRRAYRLAYACQRETSDTRLHRAIGKVHRKLGRKGGAWDDLPDKPKWMRWRTYERHVDRLCELEARLDAMFAPRLERLLVRYG
jgi:hypothetical protein